MCETFYLPVLPNAPLKAKPTALEEGLGPMRLRRNTLMDFVENDVFDSSLIDYSDDYQNNQAYSLRFKEHMKSVLSLLKEQVKKDSLIVEVGCGDGDFIEMVKADGFFKIQGFDASYKGENSAIEKRYLTEDDRIKADLVVLRHVLEHVPNPYNFLLMLKGVFGNAKIYIEVPNYDWILANNAYFDITYEHVNYFSQISLRKLFDDSLTIHRLLFDDQYQCVISDFSLLNPQFSILYESSNWEYISFSNLFPCLETHMERLEASAQGRSIYIWGAGTKGCMFLNHCKNKNLLIDKVKFAIDQNPFKIGKYLPVSLVQIKSRKEFFEVAKDNVLLIVSNPVYKDEIESQLLAAGLNQVKIETI